MTEASPSFAQVALDLPMAQLGAAWFDYIVPIDQQAVVHPGTWVLVPWGRIRRIGLVIGLSKESPVAQDRLRPLHRVLSDAPGAPEPWLRLVRFAADYYHRGIGEVALPAVPRLLRTPPAARSRGSAFGRARARGEPGAVQVAATAVELPVLNPAQAQALQALCTSRGPAIFLLHGVTGSGKTEVYLRWLADVLAGGEHRQVLLLVPEIALTPQLAAQLSARFPAERVAILHSNLPDGDRAAHWLAAAEGRARVVIGTRLAVLAPLPHLAGIVIDEEHDPSYKQQDGVRYSARDLAIAAAWQRGIPVVLGSATPSLETWLSARRGRYRLLKLPERIGGAALPALEVLDLRGKTLRHDLSPAAIEALNATVARGEQALVFINRRGYAPVLSCEQCGWLSRCPDCSAYRVLHRLSGPPRREARAAAAPVTAPRSSARYRLMCHHCGAEQAVPRSCPDCGNVDLKTIGRGTQRLEEGLCELFPAARVARLDRDVARRRGAAQQVLDAAHAGEVDILVGTQMLAKGHDFRRLSLVIAVDCDGGLFAADYRAPERLFATLMQVAGRAGRDARASRVIVQTRFPEHPLFAYLVRHDYDGFADLQLSERRQVGLPPWRFQALLRAEAATQAEALAFLTRAREAAIPFIEAQGPEAARASSGSPVTGFTTAHPDPGLFLLDPVPMAMSRLGGLERAQILIESASRPPLHRFLTAWLPALRQIGGKVRWHLDIDPAEI